MTTALLLIDMQLGNFQGPHPIHGGDRLLGRVKRLIAKARSSRTPIVFVQNDGGEGDPDETGTPGWEIHPAIQPEAGEIVVRKRSPDAFHKTDLEQVLRSADVDKLVVAGLQTEYCVDTTCRRAWSLGYEVVLVRDAHSTWDSRARNPVFPFAS